MPGEPKSSEAQEANLASLSLSDAGSAEQSSASTSARVINAPSGSVDATHSSGNQAASSSSTAVKKQARLADLPPIPPSAPKEPESDDELEHEEVEETVDAAGEEDADADGEEGVENLLADYADDENYIDLTHLKLSNKSLKRLNLPRFSKSLHRLGLRQNEISKITLRDIGSLSELKDLDLYDNGLEKTYGDVLQQGCSQLETLDYSFNSIRHISHLQELGHLRTLYFVQNKISRVRPGDLEGSIATNLRSLELGGNRLRAIENIGQLTQLEELWLGKNKITKLENLDSLVNLRILSIQSNRITKLENLANLVNLEELYISHNGLSKIEGLEQCRKLTTLDIGANRIARIENVDHLKDLEEFWANDNQIPDLNALEAQLGTEKCPNLNTVYLEGNPAQRSEGPAYRRKIILALPQLTQIDATAVRPLRIS
ncbi:L domain-like protein [Ceraceosorus guamensis]|uniref:L domain-like protein n=1 Tax=Ceraceosorus guamensis TaxID=1522189 RepID=A0A316VTU2_9BASI|nr:L domain-like protein [Ceraceosorus guamensis]PWN40922.1 L domain-like protein [Ceraceosorus guamensis]